VLDILVVLTRSIKPPLPSATTSTSPLGLIGDLQALLEQLVGLEFSRARVLTQKVHHCAELSGLDVLDRCWQEDLPSPLGHPPGSFFSMRQASSAGAPRLSQKPPCAPKMISTLRK
jgi:hypothetical protein